MTNTRLPIDDVLSDISDALESGNRLVLSAPPGAGKTTKVPLHLLKAGWLSGQKIIMLEPRRIAARRAAEFMAKSLGEKVGDTVGVRSRLDKRIGPKTRIEVVTEGVFTNLITRDPDLPGIGAVLFDEFHERSLDADLGLANAQIILGANAPFNLSDVVNGRKEIKDVAVETKKGLILVPGASGNSEVANLNSLQTQSLIQSLFEAYKGLDIIIVDSAAGLSSSNLTFIRGYEDIV